MGRPTSITPERLAPYFEAVRQGMPLSKASDFARISYSTVINARRFLWFQEEEKKARADAIEERVAIIRAAAKKGNWTAAAWWLERQEPDDFRERKEQQVTTQDEHGQTIGLKPVDYRTVAAALAPGPMADSEASS